MGVLLQSDYIVQNSFKSNKGLFQISALLATFSHYFKRGSKKEQFQIRATD